MDRWMNGWMVGWMDIPFNAVKIYINILEYYKIYTPEQYEHGSEK